MFAASHSAPAPDDDDLIPRIRAGEEAAFRTCWEYYQPRLLRFAGRYGTERESPADIVQSVFLALWRERETLSPRESLSAWLYRATRNRVLDAARRARSRHSREVELTPDIPVSIGNSGMLNVEAQETASRITAILQTVPPRAREIFYLNRVEALPPADIARILGIQPQVVYNQLSRVVRALADGLKSGV